MSRLAIPAFAALLAVSAVVALLWLAGHAPGETIRSLCDGAFGDRYSAAETAVKAIPLLLTALAVVFAFRAGAWNIGGEGQFIAGGIAALIASRAIHSAAAAIFAAAIAGGVWALLPALMKLSRNAPEVLTTILLNFVALHVLGYVVNGPLQEQGAQYPQSEAAGSTLALLGGTSLHAGLFVALLAAAAVWVVLFRTAAGLRLRAVGLNRSAAEYAGVRAAPRIIGAMVISGALAGIGGGVELLGVTHRLYERFAAGYGYSGITVALLGETHPFGAIVSSLFVAALRTGAGELQRGAGVSSAVASLAEGIAVIALAAARWRRSKT